MSREQRLSNLGIATNLPEHEEKRLLWPWRKPRTIGR